MDAMEMKQIESQLLSIILQQKTRIQNVMFRLAIVSGLNTLEAMRSFVQSDRVSLVRNAGTLTIGQITQALGLPWKRPKKMLLSRRECQIENALDLALLEFKRQNLMASQVAKLLGLSVKTICQRTIAAKTQIPERRKRAGL